jgi:potassium-transporting ATPase ATP-binding subunit
MRSRQTGALSTKSGSAHLVRQKTPNEIALNILLAGMTIIFVFATVTIPSFAAYAGGSISVIVLVALFVTLIPTTIGALLSAIGIAGMDRLVRFNVLAMSGHAVEAAGDVDTLLLDKTGTITLGNRQAAEFVPLPGVTPQELAEPRSSHRSPTRLPRVAPLWCSQRENSACASAA